MERKHLVAVNIPADGLYLAILNKANGDFSPENCSRLIRAYIDRYLEAKPDVILLNVCYRRALTPSQVFDSYLHNIETDENGYAVRNEAGQTLKSPSPTTEGVSKYFAVFNDCARPLLQKGIDIYKILTEHIRSAGCKVYLSVRMNDGHNTDNPAVNSRFAMKNGGAHSVNRDGVDLDFSQEAVRNYFYAYIEELLSTYRVDGVELDWLRFPTVLSADERSDYTILSSYMQRIRKLLDRFDRNLSLGVRVFPQEEKNLAHGMDVCRWVAEGSADMVSIENFYVPTNFEMPVAAWRESIAKRNAENRPYTLLCGSDWAVACRRGYHIPMNPALVRGFTRECLERGADGVYLFNFFEEDSFSSYEMKREDTGEYTLKSCFAERLAAARAPEGLPRRCVHIGETSRRYPISLASGEAYEYTAKTYKPYKTVRLVAGLDTELVPCLCVNGQTVALQEQKAEPGFRYGGGVKGGEFVYAVTEVTPQVVTAELPDADTLHISIKNDSCREANILWLELMFEE